MLKWSWDDAWVQKRVLTKKFAIYRRVSYETNSLTAHRLAGVASACKHRGRIRTRIARKREGVKEGDVFPLHFVGNVTRRGDRVSAMTEKVEGGWLILPRRYLLRAGTSNERAPCRRLNIVVLNFLIKSTRYTSPNVYGGTDTDILECRENFTSSRRKPKWIGRWDDCTFLRMQHT